METENIFTKVARLEAEYKDAKQKFTISKNSMEEFVNDVENRLTTLREKDKERIGELEYLLADTPGEKIRKLDIFIQSESERVRNINNDPYGAFRKEIADKKAEREQLLREMQSNASTPEEIELAELRRKSYKVTENEKDRIFEMYESSLTELAKMRSVRDSMRQAFKDLQDTVTNVRENVIGDELPDLGDRHIDGARDKFNDIERRVML